VRRRFPRLILVLLLTASRLPAVPAETSSDLRGKPFALSARSAILIDQASGRVLYQRGADQPLVPASLAKLMSLHIVYEKLADRSIRRSDVVSLTSHAWADNQAPGSTLMNLEPGQIVTVEELMKGMAVASGNDAATALAEYVAGSTQSFVRLMNEEARFLGYTVTRFTDPAGVNADNRVTAREFADFCRRYIALHPEALAELHSLREFEYPLAQNMPDGRLSPHGTKKQYNGNYLVWDDFGVDGLKTGHLDDENFTAAITARRGDMRLIAVLLGVSGSSLNDGARNRSADGMALLSYGFRNFTTIELDAPSLAPVRVWKGESRELAIAPSGPVRLTARRSELKSLAYRVVLSATVVAPIVKGQEIGALVYIAGTEEVGRIQLLATTDVAAAGLLRRMWDSVVLGVSSIVGGAAATIRLTLGTIPPGAIASGGHSELVDRRVF
jgi:serine-type D-Ala-D-Ala carboxypeptidase (penicillin-binding protein 5/6)